MQRRGIGLDITPCQLSGRDLASCLVLCAFAAVLSVVGFQVLRPAILDHETFNYWFEGDSSSLYEQMTSRTGEVHGRTSRHPLFSLLSGVPIAALERLSGVPEDALIAVWMGLVAALWIALLFAALRALGLSTASALAYSLLCSASAASWFTLPAPGHFVLGSATILAALLVVVQAERGVEIPAWILIGVAAATLAVTITNWVAGLLMLLACAGLRRGAWMAAASLGVVAVLFGVQALLVPHARIPSPEGEGRFLFAPLRGGPLDVAGVFFGSAMAAPDVREHANNYLSVQDAWPGTGSPWAIAALAGWIALLFLAVLGWRRWRRPLSTKFLVAVLALQLALHQVFGAETVLYALHWMPLLVAFAALAALDPLARRPATVLAASVAVLAAVSNGQEFVEARGHLLEHHRQRTAFLEDVGALTDPGELLVVGFGPGPHAVPVHELPEAALVPPQELERFSRRGWSLREEHWTLDRVEQLRALRGALLRQRPRTQPAPFRRLRRRADSPVSGPGAHGDPSGRRIGATRGGRSGARRSASPERAPGGYGALGRSPRGAGAAVALQLAEALLQRAQLVPALRRQALALLEARAQGLQRILGALEGLVALRERLRELREAAREAAHLGATLLQRLPELGELLRSVASASFCRCARSRPRLRARARRRRAADSRAAARSRSRWPRARRCC